LFGGELERLGDGTGAGEFVVGLHADLDAGLRGVVAKQGEHFADSLDARLEVQLRRLAGREKSDDRDAELSCQVDPGVAFLQGFLPDARVPGGQPDGGRQHRHRQLIRWKEPLQS
jgi:hypothetical protein